MEIESKIIEAYREMLIAGETEINTYTISRKAEITEKEFFEHFTSAEDVGRKVWTNIGDSVIEALSGSELYNSYPPRQKILSYYFTFFEIALNERTFIERTAESSKYTRAYKDSFKTFIGDIVQEGIAMEDIKERLSLSNYYPEVLWDLHMKLIRFWMNDQSDKFVETEKAVEMFSRVPLELMGPNLLDSVFDTLKFQVSQFKFERLRIFG